MDHRQRPRALKSKVSRLKIICDMLGRVQKNPGFSKKPNPLGFWVLGFIGFSIFLFERAVWKCVSRFSSPAKRLFRFTSTLDYRYLKIRKFISYWPLTLALSLNVFRERLKTVLFAA